jgi:hypothetical protein
MMLFLGADRLYTMAMLRWKPPQVNGVCVVFDGEKTHALKPDCVSKERWGADTYDFVTNSLGFRDDRVRTVSPQGDRPRILLLGDSFTEGKTAWAESYAGKLTVRFPQYEILNGGVSSYAPSNYWNVTRDLFREHIDFDEAFVFLDMSDTQDEAAYYRDIDAWGAVGKPVREDWSHSMTRYLAVRTHIESKLLLTNFIVSTIESVLVDHGVYYLERDLPENIFDQTRAAWTYRKVSDNWPYFDGYAPVGVAGGIAREKAKMELLWRALAARGIPLSLVVYPWPGQIVHDTVDSPQVTIWREWCAGRCKAFISLFPDFIAAKNNCPWWERGCWYRKNFVFGDFHYNANGNTMVANAVAKGIEAAPPRRHAAEAPEEEAPLLRQRTNQILSQQIGAAR